MTKDKPKIAMFISDTHVGGSATLASVLVKNINREKYKVIVVACGPGPVGEEIGRDGDEYHNLKTGSFLPLRKFKNGKYHENIFAWPALIVWLIRSTWRMFFWLRRNKIDLIHSHLIYCNLIGSFAAKLAGIPSICHIHGPPHFSWKRGGTLVGGGYLDAWLAARFVAVSHFTSSTFHRCWKKKTAVVWNAIDAKSIVSSQDRSKLREIAKVCDEEMLVGVTGFFSPRKGLDRFVEMACKLGSKRNDVKFIIVGAPLGEMGKSVMSDLMKLSETGGISEKLYFSGKLENASFYMSGMDAFFMCSRPSTETFGLVVIEAMAAGVPVVAFANDAMPEIIEDGKTGFLVPEGDTTAAAERISQILDDPKLAAKFKKAGQERIFKNFDIPILIDNIEKLYANVLQ
jgi:glycosyltransferase involved in cell wall biosynthesis